MEKEIFENCECGHLEDEHDGKCLLDHCMCTKLRVLRHYLIEL